LRSDRRSPVLGDARLEPLGQFHRLGEGFEELCVFLPLGPLDAGLATLALAPLAAHALACMAELCHKACLLELGEGTGNLTHRLLKGIVGRGEVVAGGREHSHSPLYQRQDAELLGDELAGKPCGVFDQHRSNTVSLDAIEESEKAWPRLDRIGAGDGRVIVGIDNLKARVLGVGVDGVALPLVAALVRANVGCRARARSMADAAWSSGLRVATQRVRANVLYPRLL
jgi:hypothetical protein